MKSINHRAPARFLLELERKVEAVGGVYAEVDTKEFKASQYNHVTGISTFGITTKNNRKKLE